MELLLHAISITAPETNFNSFDIITDRQNLQLLIDFASYCGQNQNKFRFEAEIVDDRVILSWWIDWEWRRSNFGYRKEFEKAFTKTPDCLRGSLVYKHAVGYTIGGLRLMVRFEVDACLQEAPAELASMSCRRLFRGSPMFSAHFRTSHDFWHPFPPVSTLTIGFRNIFRIRFPQVYDPSELLPHHQTIPFGIVAICIIIIILVANN